MCVPGIIWKKDEDSLVYELRRRECNRKEMGVCVREVMEQNGDSLGKCVWDALLKGQKWRFWRCVSGGKFS